MQLDLKLDLESSDVDKNLESSESSQVLEKLNTQTFESNIFRILIRIGLGIGLFQTTLEPFARCLTISLTKMLILVWHIADRLASLSLQVWSWQWSFLNPNEQCVIELGARIFIHMYTVIRRRSTFLTVTVYKILIDNYTIVKNSYSFYTINYMIYHLHNFAILRRKIEAISLPR